MEENKFEKQVQQQMDELEIQPSGTVWEKIELQIEKKKSRGWGLIILFLLIGFILPGGYWLWNARQQITSEDANSAKTGLEKNVNQTSMKENKNKKHYKFLTDSKANQKINLEEKNSMTFARKKEIPSAIHGNSEAEIISVPPSQKQSSNKNSDRASGDSIPGKINVDSSSRAVVPNIKTKSIDTSKQKQTNTETVKQSKKNKWGFGILFSGGISGVGNDFLALSNPPANSISGSLNSGGQQSGFSSPVTKAGFGFITGVYAEKSISKKAKFILSINFKSFSTSVKLHDSSGTYSARSGSSKYINYFNFIELPVSIQIQIGRGKHMPLFWQGSIAISELISTNALQLNSSTGYYYYNNSLFDKTQIGFNTALLASLFSKQRNSILIGPYFYYDASKIANEALYNKKQFVFTGLHTEIIFGK